MWGIAGLEPSSLQWHFLLAYLLEQATRKHFWWNSDEDSLFPDENSCHSTATHCKHHSTLCHLWHLWTLSPHVHGKCRWYSTWVGVRTSVRGKSETTSGHRSNNYPLRLAHCLCTAFSLGGLGWDLTPCSCAVCMCRCFSGGRTGKHWVLWKCRYRCINHHNPHFQGKTSEGCRTWAACLESSGNRDSRKKSVLSNFTVQTRRRHKSTEITEENSSSWFLSHKETTIKPPFTFMELYLEVQLKTARFLSSVAFFVSYIICKFLHVWFRFTFHHLQSLNVTFEFDDAMGSAGRFAFSVHLFW